MGPSNTYCILFLSFPRVFLPFTHARDSLMKISWSSLTTGCSGIFLSFSLTLLLSCPSPTLRCLLQSFLSLLWFFHVFLLLSSCLVWLFLPPQKHTKIPFTHSSGKHVQMNIATIPFTYWVEMYIFIISSTIDYPAWVKTGTNPTFIKRGKQIMSKRVEASEFTLKLCLQWLLKGRGRIDWKRKHIDVKVICNISNL